MPKITRCEGTKVEFGKNHDACGLSIGDLVHVTRLPESFEGGWGCNTVIDGMKSYVGGVFKIQDSSNVYGFKLVNKTYPLERGYCYFNWPYFVLDKVASSLIVDVELNLTSTTNTFVLNKVKDESAQTHTNSTLNKKQNKMTPFIFHSPRTVSKRAYTLAGVLDESQTIATLRIGLSVCSDTDNLNKKIGSSAAIGRANKVPIFILQLTAEEQNKSLRKFLEFANTFTPTFALRTKLKLEVNL